MLISQLRADARQASPILRPAPETPVSAPYSFRHGAFDITVLTDGFITIPQDILLTNGAPDERAALLPRLDTVGDAVRPKANIPALRAGADLILIDIGAGHKYQPTDGRLADNLAAAAIDPGAVTKVVFSHAHPDHIWATLDESGRLRFPNATYYVGAVEWDFWTDPDFLINMPPALHDFARGAQRDLGAVRERVVMLQPGDEVVTGLQALATPGHTPGHLSFEAAGGDGLLITVDVANNELVSFEHPDWRFGYDTDPDLAIRTRGTLLDRIAKDRMRLLGYHWAYPGLGFAERHGGGFHFTPSA
jgi:glyoxylase-like metal-dependent hydrolase (beta-lactamase superfamily II)